MNYFACCYPLYRAQDSVTQKFAQLYHGGAVGVLVLVLVQTGVFAAT